MMMIIIIESTTDLVKHGTSEMRISKAQAKENRERVLGAAASLFRAHGFDGVAVSDLMKAAGFTHGGFYNHFTSKEALAAEALGRAWTEIAATRARATDLEQFLAGYLSRAARRAPHKSCPAAALAGDVSRQPAPVKAVFADGLEEMIGYVEALLPPAGDAATRERAIDLVARIVGALALSRAVPDASPLADELLEATRRTAMREAGQPQD
ncbi:MAG TPA: helix-turn-helix domain-containing protein [Alphaproteobacteria bacterium]|jgi:TetR/AcrR family transcriptional repressor of nem operon|nr:helix-turn-helix domain-containing protein [Alphaproteobacteria bacterium]